MTIDSIIKTTGFGVGRLAGIDGSIKVIGNLLAEGLGTRSSDRGSVGQ